MRNPLKAKRIFLTKIHRTKDSIIPQWALNAHMKNSGKSRSNMTKSEKDFIRFWSSRLGSRFIDFSASVYSRISGIEANKLSGIYQYVVKLYTERVISEGLLEASKELKAICGISTRYAANHKFSPLPFVKNGNEGLPTKIGPLIPYLNGRIEERSAMLFILHIYKLHVDEVQDVDTNSIKDPNTLGCVNEDLGGVEELYFDTLRSRLDPNSEDAKLLGRLSQAFIRELQSLFPKQDLLERLNTVRKRSELHLSAKNGPNGQAIKSAILDVFAVVNSHLKDDIISLATLTRNLSLLEVISNVSSVGVQFESKDGKEPLVLSRLRIKSEPGGKGRLFAILDYATQSAMTGIHSTLYSILDTLGEDGTSSHDRVAEDARQWSMEDEPLYSADLSSATDRFVALLQKFVISWLFGRKIGQHWFNLMTNRSFYHNGENLRFTVGQPLGALSSWAAFALTHHVLVRACKRLVLDSNEITDYRIIGDDIIIKGGSLYELYHYVMTKFIEVTINPIKGYTPETSLGGTIPGLENESLSVIEVAKRVFVNGKELTPISPVVMLDGLRSPSYFPDFLREISRRYDVPDQGRHPAVEFAPLTFKVSKALLFATYPLSPAPLTGLTEASWYEAGKEIYPTIPWFNQGWQAQFQVQFLALDELRQAVNRESLDHLVSSIESSSLLDLDHQMVLSHWLFTSDYLHSFLDLIQKQCKDKVLRYYYEYPYHDLVVTVLDPISGSRVQICPSRSFLIEEKGFGVTSTLKEYLGFRTLASSIRDILNGKSRREEPDKFRSRITSTFKLNVAKRLSRKQHTA